MGYSNTSYRRIQTAGQPEESRLGDRKTVRRPSYTVKDKMNYSMIGKSLGMSPRQVKSVQMSPKGKLPSFMMRLKKKSK